MFAFVPDVSSAKGAATHILNLLRSIPEIDAESTEGDAPANVRGQIRFENVHFRYPTRPGVRADIQMIAAPARAPGLSRSPRAASPASLPSAGDARSAADTSSRRRARVRGTVTRQRESPESPVTETRGGHVCTMYPPWPVALTLGRRVATLTGSPARRVRVTANAAPESDRVPAHAIMRRSRGV